MKKNLIALVIAAGSFALAGNALAEDAPPPETTPPEVETGAGAIRDLRIEFRQQRLAMLEEFLQARRELRERLKNATEEERAAILTEFRALYKEQIEAERELRKQLRNEIHDVRRTRREVVAEG